jgi:aquaporin Z
MSRSDLSAGQAAAEMTGQLTAARDAGAGPRASRLAPRIWARSAHSALRAHWPEYLMEAAGLGAFMISACLCVALLEHPASPVHRMLGDADLRRVLIGIAMGVTAIAIIYSPWGKRSGAHLNPAVTFTFWRLGKIAGWDALFYVAAQFAGGLAGVLVSAVLLSPDVIAHASVNYVVTQPGGAGPGIAFLAEMAISFGLMLAVLIVSNRPAINRYTGLVAGVLVAVYIGAEAPLSGTSMNAARSVASALPSQASASLWIYFVAPLAGMLLAAQVYLDTRRPLFCCKLHHDNDQPCIFHCSFPH